MRDDTQEANGVVIRSIGGAFGRGLSGDESTPFCYCKLACFYVRELIVLS